MRNRHLAAMMLVLALSGCGAPGSPDDLDHVVQVEDDDPRMLAAIDEARATIDQFIGILGTSDQEEKMVSLKVPFKDGDAVEFMWLSDVGYLDGKFYGVVANEPQSVRNVRMGQAVTFDRDEIADWMYVENGKLVGGYSMKVLLEVMTPAERAEFHRSAPFRLD